MNPLRTRSPSRIHGRSSVTKVASESKTTARPRSPVAVRLLVDNFLRATAPFLITCDGFQLRREAALTSPSWPDAAQGNDVAEEAGGSALHRDGIGLVAPSRCSFSRYDSPDFSRCRGRRTKRRFRCGPHRPTSPDELGGSCRVRSSSFICCHVRSTHLREFRDKSPCRAERQIVGEESADVRTRSLSWPFV